MANPRFSFLIPVYNQVGKMDRCIESVKAQTFTDFEVVLVNDGSTDGSGDMLKGLAEEDDRFKVVSHETNKSLLRARFTGMKNASGDYMVFLDSDDYVNADLLSALNDLIEKEHPDVIRYGRVIEPKHFEMMPKHCEDPLRDFLSGENDPRIVETCISRRVTEKAVASVEPPYVNNTEDTFMSGVLYTFAESFAYLDKPYYHYEIYGGMSRNNESLSMEKLKRVRESLDNCSNALLEFYEKNHPELLELGKKACSNFFKYEMAHFILNSDDPAQAIGFINGLSDDRFPDVYTYACNDILEEFFRRRLVKDHVIDLANKFKYHLF